MTGRDLDALQTMLGTGAVFCRRTLSGRRGVALPPLVDHHVHLHLIDSIALVRGGVAAVVDLGGDPAALVRLPRNGMPHAAYAGAFLTVPGGYPAGRAWAPDAIVRVVTSSSGAPGEPGGARTAVDEQADAGASVIKVALNSDAGPVLDRARLDAVVAAARDRGLPVVAHAQGRGMVELAVAAGVEVLAHTPFTERLAEGVIARAVEQGQRWISTLSIPDIPVETAVENLRAFAAAGGSVLYGTDLGNGDRAPGVITEELALLQHAGVRGPSLIATLTDPWPFAGTAHGVATFVDGEPPSDVGAVAEWLASARVVPEEELVHDES